MGRARHKSAKKCVRARVCACARQCVYVWLRTYVRVRIRVRVRVCTRRGVQRDSEKSDDLIIAQACVFSAARTSEVGACLVCVCQCVYVQPIHRHRCTT